MTVLIVDDNPMSRKLLKFTLEIEGFQVIEKADGAEAMDAMQKEKVDCVVSDILMPNMDGYMLVFLMQKNAKLAEVPVILYSSTYDSASDEKLSLQAGARKFIKKPAPPEEVVQAVRELTGKKLKPRTEPAVVPDELDVMKQYSKVLIEKLELRNQELTVKTAELEELNAELSEFGRTATGREMKMVELKKEVNELCKELGRPPRYDLSMLEEEKKEP